MRFNQRCRKILKQLNNPKSFSLSKNVFILANKSTNIYVMEKGNQNRYLRQNITETYQKEQTDAKLSQSTIKIKNVEKILIDDSVKKM